MKITIQEKDNLGRLDKFIAEKLPHLSRAFIQKQIKDNRVKVNSKAVNAHYTPKIGDVVEIEKTKQEEPKIMPNKDIAFDVLDETSDFIIINKPAGLVIHPAHGVHEPTLADALAAKYPEIKHVGEDALRPGIVHRLDRDVSGLIVVARTQEMFNHLKTQFQERRIIKEYTALAHGAIDEENGTIETPIGRSKTKDGKMAAHPVQKRGKTSRGERGETSPRGLTSGKDREAKTKFEVLKRFRNYTLLKIKILTGRSHQIRVHMNSIGRPIVGDALYANKKIKQPNLNRLFLHASKLAFDDLSGERKEYASDLPKELIEFLSSP